MDISWGKKGFERRGNGEGLDLIWMWMDGFIL